MLTKIKIMLTSILYLLLYIVVAAIVLWAIFKILTLIFPSFILDARIQGLLYALALIIILIWSIGHFGLIRV